PSFLFADFVLKQPVSAKRLLVLLHGYEESGSRIFEKLKDAMPEDAAVLAPNGPFPIPRRSDGGYRMGFSWYFYDASTDEYFIDMEIGVGFVTRLVEELGLSALPTTLIGFSQGGYIAPFVGQALRSVDRVMGLGSQFLKDEMSLPVSFRMDAI